MSENQSKRSRWAMFGWLVAGVLLVGVVAAYIRYQFEYTQAQQPARLKAAEQTLTEGMTETEVEKVLGVAPNEAMTARWTGQDGRPWMRKYYYEEDRGLFIWRFGGIWVHYQDGRRVGLPKGD